MKMLTEEVIRFIQNQGYVIVSTLDKNGAIHNSCKGVVDINKNGRLYLLDLYQARTYSNLQQNDHLSVTSVDEHRFKGYCLKGIAHIIPVEKLSNSQIEAWDLKINSRITQRLLRNIREEKGHPRHPEALLPKPEYMIEMEVQEVVDLTPPHLKAVI